MFWAGFVRVWNAWWGMLGSFLDSEGLFIFIGGCAVAVVTLFILFVIVVCVLMIIDR